MCAHFTDGASEAVLTSLAPPNSPPSGDRPCLPRQPVPQVRAGAAALQMEGKSRSQCPPLQDRRPPLPPLLLQEEGCHVHWARPPLSSDKPDEKDKLRQDEWTRSAPCPTRILILIYPSCPSTLSPKGPVFWGQFQGAGHGPCLSGEDDTSHWSTCVPGPSWHPGEWCSIHSKGRPRLRGGDVSGSPDPGPADSSSHRRPSLPRRSWL